MRRDREHFCEPKWAKSTKRLPSVLRCAVCGKRVLGTGRDEDPWRCSGLSGIGFRFKVSDATGDNFIEVEEVHDITGRSRPKAWLV